MYSGLTHLAPELRDKMPRAGRSLMAWQRLANPAEGGPVPQAALGFIMQEFLRAKKYHHAYVTLLSYDCILRESDWETLTMQDIHIVPSAAGRAPVVSLRLGAGARGLATKTGSDRESSWTTFS